MTRRTASAQFRWIAGIWRPFRVRLGLIAAGQIVSMAVTASLPLVLKRLFDDLAHDPTLDELQNATLLWFGLATLDWLLAAALVLSRGTMNLRFEWAVRERAWARLVRLGPAFFQKYRTGDLVTRLTDDVADKLSWFVCSGIFRAAAAMTVVVFGIAMMLRLDPWLTLFTAGPLPVLVVLFIRAGSLLDRQFDEVQKRISEMNEGLEACFSGIRVVKAFGRESAEHESFMRSAAACRESEIAAAKGQTLVNALYGQVWQLGIIAVLLAGGWAVMSGGLTIGTFIAFDAYVLMLVFPMIDIGTFFVKGWQSAVSIARVREIEEAPVAVAEAPGAGPMPSGRGHLQVRGVSFGWDGGPQVLHGVSLDAAPGEMVALAGGIGSGKSTLLRMFPRLVDPGAGEISLDGVPLREWPLAALREAVAWVPQDPILLSGTIEENVRFGREGIDEARLARAVSVSRLEADLAQLSGGLGTRVGVRGVSLSGGQKQRVALARALAGRPRLLVLDDPTAALDARTEAALWDGLHRLLPDLATIVVTHRPATLERATRVVVLESGRVVESGTHAELTRAGGVYAGLYRRHQLEERVGLGPPRGAPAGEETAETGWD